MINCLPPGELVRSSQMVLVVCCLCYAVWWYTAFRPGSDSRTLAGKKGVWFALTVLTGGVGVFGNAVGIHLLPESAGCSVRDICLWGVIVYAGLVVVTYGLWRRSITAELALIVAWCGEEFSAVQALAAGKYLSEDDASVMIFAVLGATFLSLLAYTLYYKTETRNPQAAFWLGMAPLVIAAAVMASLSLCII